MAEVEQWRPVTTHSGYYEVSDCGRVRSVDRVIAVSPSCQAPNGFRFLAKGKILRPGIHPDRSRHQVCLWRDHVKRLESVHVLVLEAFVGPRPEGMYGCHRDDDPANNCLDNLYWGTPAQNSADKIANGNQPFGEKCTSAKLSADEVSRIRRPDAGSA